MSRGLPTIYQVILKRLFKDSIDGKISLGRARSILSYIHRIPKNKITMVFAEMQKQGCIKINGQRFIHLLTDYNEL